MKLLPLTLLLFFPAYLQAAPLNVLSDTLQIDDQCRLKVTNKAGKSRLIKLNLPKSPACQYVVYSGTNTIDMRLIGNAYMFFIELQKGSGANCRSTYVAVAAREGRPIITSALPDNTGNCPARLDMYQFDFFARDMKVLG